MTAKHSALNRANGVRVPAVPRWRWEPSKGSQTLPRRASRGKASLRPRDPGSANGRPLRSERRCRGSSPRPGTPELGDRLMAGRQALTLFIEVRVLVPERIRSATKALFDNRIVDDARGRAPPRPQQCPCSRSGEGACLKRRRCWFDSRRGHDQLWNPQRVSHLSRWASRGKASLRPTRDSGWSSGR